MSINIGASTLSHRIHGFIKNDPYSANKEYIDNQEDAIEAFKEQKDCPEDYKPKIILHIEREINDDLTERTTITRLDNGCGMNNIDVYIDPSNSTTKKDKNGNYCEGMFNSALSLKPYTQTVVSRGSNNKANSLIFYPSKMIKTKEVVLAVSNITPFKVLLTSKSLQPLHINEIIKPNVAIIPIYMAI